jgi:hypothetical protein
MNPPEVTTPFALISLVIALTETYPDWTFYQKAGWMAVIGLAIINLATIASYCWEKRIEKMQEKA